MSKAGYGATEDGDDKKWKKLENARVPFKSWFPATKLESDVIVKQHGLPASTDLTAWERKDLIDMVVDGTLDQVKIHKLPKYVYKHLMGKTGEIYLAHWKAEENDQGWWNTYDKYFLFAMSTWLVVLVGFTMKLHPGLIFNLPMYYQFWGMQVFKLIFMLTVAYIGGSIVLVCEVKVNYTRKVQHFCAYIVPLTMALIIDTTQFQHGLAETVVCEWWGYWWTMLSFFVFIYPIRTRCSFIDKCFCSLDRPEDRPDTLLWITTQIFLGYIIMSCYTAYMTYSHQLDARELIFIPVIITGIGDGLAEPVGITWGRHKYKTAALGGGNKLYTRSYEGSLCVFLSGIIAATAEYGLFKSELHYWSAMITVPITMTVAEAFSPHTWDTPFLLITGAGLLWAQTYIPVSCDENETCFWKVLGASFAFAVVVMGIAAAFLHPADQKPKPAEEESKRLNNPVENSV